MRGSWERKRNIRLTIQYWGERYAGWQRQKDHPSIQGTLEKAIAKMTKEPIQLIGSGRTDAGVHARAQVANFHTHSTIPIHGFLKGLNSLLPWDIAVTEVKEAPIQFHARRDAVEKRYRYHIAVSETPLPLLHPFVWVVPPPMKPSYMEEAARLVVGTHDFAGFMASGSGVSTTVRNVTCCSVSTTPSPIPGVQMLMEVELAANGFLRYMVRNIVGLLVEIGRSRRPPEAVQEVLESGDRALAGPTAPARGLCLWEVIYSSKE